MPDQMAENEKQAAVEAAATPCEPVRPTSYRRRALLTFSVILVILLIWWGSGYIFAYTDDAYLTSDIISVTPEVSGPVDAVGVSDNQWVKRGTPLFSIDPEPFRLALAQSLADERKAEAQLPVDQAEVQALAAQRDAAGVAAQLSAEDLHRSMVLSTSGTVSPQALDHTQSIHDQSVAELRSGEAALRKAVQSMQLHQAATASAHAATLLAKWRLSRTNIVAPVDGYVTHLTLQRGDMATTDKPVVGMVAARSWRIVANYKEYYLRHLEPGHTAWIWLDSRPWHLYRARIQGVAHGISREPGNEALVPYVSPTVDWIRLQRRVPVRLTLLESPGDAQLYMGADARVLVLY